MKAGVAAGPIRVLLADSNQTQSQLLAGALRRQSAFVMSSCGAELLECLQALDLSPVDILLIGDRPGDADQQQELLRVLHRTYPELAIILLFDSFDRSLVVNSVRAGVRGLFCRTSQPFKALCKCICAVHSGQIWANTEQMGYVVEALAHSPVLSVTNSRGDVLLTQRENQVVTLVAEGLGNREIASQLKITENTVKKSLLRIFDKLGISNRVELVLYALTSREPDSETAAETACPHPSRLPQCRLDFASGKDHLVDLDLGTSPVVIDVAS